MLADMVLTIGDFGALGGLIALPMGGVAAFVWHRTEKLDDRIVAVESDKADRREVEKRIRAIERDKVDKHEWVRETMRTREMLDKLNAQCSTIEAKIDVSYGIPAAIKTLSAEIRANRTEHPGE